MGKFTDRQLDLLQRFPGEIPHLNEASGRFLFKEHLLRTGEEVYVVVKASARHKAADSMLSGTRSEPIFISNKSQDVLIRQTRQRRKRYLLGSSVLVALYVLVHVFFEPVMGAIREYAEVTFEILGYIRYLFEVIGLCFLSFYAIKKRKEEDWWLLIFIVFCWGMFVYQMFWTIVVWFAR